MERGRTTVLPSEFDDPAEAYQIAVRNQSYSRSFAKAHETHYAPWIQQLVADAPLHVQSGERIALPQEPEPLTMPIGQAITKRRSGRTYGSEGLSALQLGTLLTLAGGLQQPAVAAQSNGSLHRNVPNSGNLGSVEIYPVIMRADGIRPGIYHFDSVQHDLALMHSGHFATWLRELVLFQLEFADAAVALVLTSAFGRLKAKYGPRGYRLGLLDVGHVSQSVYLLATSMGLQVCATAGFIDEALETALALDGIDTAVSLLILLGTTPHSDAVT